ncbi:MAG: lipid-binding SYLF domain-containing protein [Verrucomicrobiota bacterium]
MKRLSLCLFALLTLAAPLHAKKTEHQKTLEKIESCEAIIREFMADPDYAIPAGVLNQAEALVITNQVNGGLIVGLRYGYGVVLAKQPDGGWSIPVLLRAGEGSVGLQVGANTVETVYVITDREAVANLYSTRFNIGVDARAVATPHSANVEKVNESLPAPAIYAFTKKRGLYAGASVKTGWVSRDDEINFNFYQTDRTLPELLYGRPKMPVTGEVAPLVDYVAQITR